MIQKLSVLLFTFLFLFTQNVFSQNTAPVPTTFTILGNSTNPSYGDLLKNPTNPILRGDQVQLQAYSVDYGDAIDSIFYPLTAQINMANSEGEIKYDIEVAEIGYGSIDSSLYAVDSTVTITIRKQSYRLDSTATVIVWLNQPNRNVVDSLGWTFNNTVSVGDKFRVVLTYDYLTSADNDGRLETAARLTDGDSVLTTDDLSRTLVVLPFIVHNIHEGVVYEIGFDSTFSVNDTMLFGFVLPTDTLFCMHVGFSIATSAGSWYNLVQGDTVAGGADTVSIFNAMWESSNTSVVEIYRNAVATETGTEKPGTYIGAGQQSGGEAHPLGEYVWCGGVSKHHLLRFISLGNSNRVTIRVRWAEFLSKK